MKKNQSMQLRQNNKGREIRLVEIIQMYTTIIQQHYMQHSLSDSKFHNSAVIFLL